LTELPRLPNGKLDRGALRERAAAAVRGKPSTAPLRTPTEVVLAVSRAATVHVNAPAECVRAKNATTCLTVKGKPDKKEEQL